MNSFYLTGVNIGSDPTLNDAKTIAHMNVAESVKYLDKMSGSYKTKTNWFTITLFGKNVKLAENYLKKGMRINLLCNISPNEYTDKNGNKIKSINIVAERIEFFSTKAEKEEKEERRNEGFISVDGLDGEGVPFD